MNEAINQATDTTGGQPGRTHRSTVLASCVCAILAGGPAAALELGEPVVRSGLGQPLEVIVPYTTWGSERLTADCVSLVRGDATGLPSLTAGRVSSTAGNRLVIRSNRGIREPLLALNLKVDCPSSPFIVRSYTLIIDPPSLLAAAPQPAPLPAPRRAPAEPAAVLPAAPSAARSSRAAAPAEPLDEALDQGTDYRVRVGDTLSTIAARVSERPDTIWTTAERIFAANPEAFIGGDMDRLRAGSVLEIPELGETAPLATSANAAEKTTAPAATRPVSEPAGESATAAGTASGFDAGATASMAESRRPASAAPADSSDSADPADSADSIRPAVRQAMDEMAASGRTGTPAVQAGQSAEPASPFKAEAGADGGTVQTPAGPAPRLSDADPAQRSAVSPLFAALFGAGIGLLLGLVIFRSSVREFFRRAPAPAAAGKVSIEAEEGAGAAGDATDVMAAPVFEREEPDFIVSEEEWSDVDQSKLRSLDMELDEGDDDALSQSVITEQELAVARMNFPGADDSETVDEVEGPAELAPEDRIDESMIMEVDTGAELAAKSSSDDTAEDMAEDMAENTAEAAGETDDTGTVATVADLEMLEEDYEQEFTATQRLARQLADAAIALDDEIAAHGDEIDEDIAGTAATTEAQALAATSQAADDAGGENTAITAILDRDSDIIDEGDQTAVLSADEATTEMPGVDDRNDDGGYGSDGSDGSDGDTVEHTGVHAAATTELPSAEEPFAEEPFAEEDDDRETDVIPLSEKRRA